MKRSTSYTDEESRKQSKLMHQHEFASNSNDNNSLTQRSHDMSANDVTAPSIRNELMHLLRHQRGDITTITEQQQLPVHHPLMLTTMHNLNQRRPMSSFLESMIHPRLSQLSDHAVVTTSTGRTNLQPSDNDNEIGAGGAIIMQDQNISQARQYEQLQLLLQRRRQEQQGQLELLEAGLMRSHAQTALRNQQRQGEIHRLRQEIQMMQLYQQEGQAYSTIMSTALLGNVSANMSPHLNDLRNIQQPQLYRRLLLDQISAMPHLSDNAMELSLQSQRYLSALHMNSERQLMHTSGPDSRSTVATALTHARLTALRGTTGNWNLSVMESPISSSVPMSLPVSLVGPTEKQNRLSHQQRLLRQQIQVFEANHEDVTTHTRGRNKPISFGQVGIRCKHCAHIAVSQRQKGSTYFPSTKLGLYQAAQNMSTTHLQSGVCEYIPESITLQFRLISEHRQLQSEATSSSSNHGAGRPYWAECASRLGLVDTEDHGIRFIRNLPSNVVLVDEA